MVVSKYGPGLGMMGRSDTTRRSSRTTFKRSIAREILRVVDHLLVEMNQPTPVLRRPGRLRPARPTLMNTIPLQMIERILCHHHPENERLVNSKSRVARCAPFASI